MLLLTGGHQHSVTYSCCSSQQKRVSYLLLLLSVALFLVELRQPVAYFSKFVDMTINLSLILQRTQIQIACENIRFSSLFVAGDVLRGGTSATQQQKFHTYDVKSVQNAVRSPDWSKEQLHCFSHCLRVTDKRQKATKVKCKCDESLTKQSIFVEYSLLYNKHLSFAGARSQMNTTLYQNRSKKT